MKITYHSGVPRAGDWEYPKKPKNWGEADMQEKEEYEFNLTAFLSNTFEFDREEDVRMIVDRLPNDAFNPIPHGDIYGKVKDGTTVDLPVEIVNLDDGQLSPIMVARLLSGEKEKPILDASKFNSGDRVNHFLVNALRQLNSEEITTLGKSLIERGKSEPAPEDGEEQKTGAVLKEVYNERQRQETKWGQQNHSPAHYLMILGEEVGEANKAALEAHFDGKPLSDYREELIQVAAVAVAMVECLDRQTPQP